MGRSEPREVVVVVAAAGAVGDGGGDDGDGVMGVEAARWLIDPTACPEQNITVCQKYPKGNRTACVQIMRKHPHLQLFLPLLKS